MANNELRELLYKSNSIDSYYKIGRDNGLTYMEMHDNLTYLGTIQDCYGDYSIYKDAGGHIWNEYFSIGV